MALLLLSAIATSLFTGCGGTAIPDVVPMKVTVLSKTGGPVNNARIRFIPLIEGLDGNYIAEGVTDDNGVCELAFPGSDEPGCCACPSKVLVLEGPEPEEARAAYFSDGGAAIERFKTSLKNRPIPMEYGSVSKTPLECAPSESVSEYEIKFKK